MGAPLSSREASRNVTSSSSPANRTDGHSRANHAVGARRLADPRVLQDLLDLEDPALVLALLLLGGVITAVLTKIALLASRLNPLCDLDPQWSRALVQFGLEAVVRLLGQPGDASVAGLGHRHSSVLRGVAMSQESRPAGRAPLGVTF